MSRKRKAAVVILTSSAKANANIGGTARTRLDQNGKTKDDGHFNLSGTIADGNSVYTMIMKVDGAEVTGTLFGVNSREVNRKKGMEKIQEAFESRKHEDVIIYYSGHGMGGEKGDTHGAWCFYDGIIRPKDVILSWRVANYRHPMKGRKLLIISDSCFSGQWVDDAKHYKTIYVQAACKPDQKSSDTAKGGLFTQTWIATKPERYYSDWNSLNPLFAVGFYFVQISASISSAFSTQDPYSTRCRCNYVKLHKIGSGMLIFYTGSYRLKASSIYSSYILF